MVEHMDGGFLQEEKIENTDSWKSYCILPCVQKLITEI